MTLAADYEQVLAFRRRAMHLVERLPTRALAAAAHAGLQDSAPRAAVLSLGARRTGTSPDDWEDEELAQIWGPRGAVYVVPERDVGVFTLGRLPRDPDQQAALAALVDTNDRGQLRWASPTGRIRIRWDARDTTSTIVDPPQEADDPEPLRRELARRFLTWLGPATAGGFAWWAGVDPADAAQTWAGLAAELTTVTVDGREAQLLTIDVAALAAAAATRRPHPEPVRWLPQGDPYLGAADRNQLLPDRARRDEVFPKGVWPGVLLIDGDIVGTWRRQQGRIQATLWHPLPASAIADAEAEAAQLPLRVEPGTIRVEWRGATG